MSKLLALRKTELNALSKWLEANYRVIQAHDCYSLTLLKARAELLARLKAYESLPQHNTDVRALRTGLLRETVQMLNLVTRALET